MKRLLILIPWILRIPWAPVILAVLVVLLIPLMVLAQATRQTDHGTVSTSGGTLTFPNTVGAVAGVSFEELFSGSPATVSVVIRGCKIGGTCDTLDTNTTVAAAIVTPTVAKPYDYFTVNASWTGGTSPTISINTTFTLARSGSNTGAVTSVFGRTGAVVAASNDYSFAQLSGKPTTLSGYGITDGVSTARAVNTTSPLAGGGALSGDLTLTCTTCGLTSNPLSQFAATTSAQLAGVLSDETGSGLAVFATSPALASPTFTTPVLGTPTSGVMTNVTGLPLSSGVTGQLPVANGGTAAATAAAARISLFPTASEPGDLVYCATFSSGNCTSWALFAGNTSGTKVLQETSSGVPSWVTPSVTWDAIGAPAGALSLSMGGNVSTFNTTSALSAFFAWKNTTAAVVGTSQGSPILSLCGRAFHGSADVEDCMTWKTLPGNGNDAAIAFTFGHSGTSTGAVTIVGPGSWQAATVSTGPTFNFTSHTGTGIGITGCGASCLGLWANGTETVDVLQTTGVSVLPTLGYGWPQTAGLIGSNDSGICRSAAGGTEATTDTGTCNSNGFFIAAGYKSGGTKYTLSSNGCSATTTLGGASVGSFVSGTTGTCAVTILMGNSLTAATGWHCTFEDHTTPANFLSQTGAADTTHGSMTGTTVSGDLISFGCQGY